MSMLLTPADLQAIKTIFDEGIEDSKLHSAAGFAEVHEKIGNLQYDMHELRQDVNGIKIELAVVKDDLNSVKKDLSGVKDDLNLVKDDLSSVKDTVENIERIQRAEIGRVDRQELTINKMRKAMKAV